MKTVVFYFDTSLLRNFRILMYYLYTELFNLLAPRLKATVSFISRSKMMKIEPALQEMTCSNTRVCTPLFKFYE